MRDRNHNRKISTKDCLTWITDDISYLVQRNINILLQLRAYGVTIHKNYGLSFFGQWFRMAYLAFVLRAGPKSFRNYQLFRQDRWEKVNEYTYGHQNEIHDQFPGFSSPEEYEILKNKRMFFEYCRSHNLNTPPIVAVFENGQVTYPEDKTFTLPPTDLFIKELRGGAGRGAKKLHYSSGVYRDYQRNEFLRDDIYRHLSSYSEEFREILLQEAVTNHDSWKKFSNGSLVTCRLVTARSPYKEEIIPMFASLRMPTGEADADNYSLGGIAAPIDIETGIIGQASGAKPIQDSFQFDYHPDTEKKINGTKVPYWEKLLEHTQQIHQNFKTIFVGWDVSMTEEGFCIVEGNGAWGSNVIEGPSGVSIADTSYPELFENWLEKMSGDQENRKDI